MDSARGYPVLTLFRRGDRSDSGVWRVTELGYRVTMRVTAQSWECQLLNVEVLDDGVLLDLVALDGCPFAGFDLPAGWPFVVRIVEQHEDRCVDLVESWAADGAVISLRVLYDGSGAKWLDVAAADHHLILEIR